MPSNATRLTWNSRKGKQRSENRAFVLFIYLKLPNKNKTVIWRIYSTVSGIHTTSRSLRDVGTRDRVGTTMDSRCVINTFIGSSRNSYWDLCRKSQSCTYSKSQCCTLKDLKLRTVSCVKRIPLMAAIAQVRLSSLLFCILDGRNFHT